MELVRFGDHVDISCIKYFDCFFYDVKVVVSKKSGVNALFHSLLTLH